MLKLKDVYIYRITWRKTGDEETVNNNYVIKMTRKSKVLYELTRDQKYNRMNSAPITKMATIPKEYYSAIDELSNTVENIATIYLKRDENDWNVMINRMYWKKEKQLFEEAGERVAQRKSSKAENKPKTEREKINKIVKEYQQAIYKAERDGNKNKRIKLQRKLGNHPALKKVAYNSLKMKDKIKYGDKMKVLDLKLGKGADPIKRVWIPKPGSDKLRPIGIPTVKDKILQKMAKMVIEPVWRARNERTSKEEHGFTQGKNCHTAVKELMEMKGSEDYVANLDIVKCFDKLKHGKIRKAAYSGWRLDQQIKKWLEAPVIDNGKKESNKEGTPQGGVISPLLANMTLHEKTKAEKYVKYADDIRIVSKKKKWLRYELMKTKKAMRNVGAELTAEVTKGITEFLGYEINGENKVKIAKKKREKLRKAIEEVEAEELIVKAKGWNTYYGWLITKEDWHETIGQVNKKISEIWSVEYPEELGEIFRERYSIP